MNNSADYLSWMLQVIWKQTGGSSSWSKNYKLHKNKQKIQIAAHAASLLKYQTKIHKLQTFPLLVCTLSVQLTYYMIWHNMQVLIIPPLSHFYNIQHRNVIHFSRLHDHIYFHILQLNHQFVPQIRNNNILS